MDRLKLHARKDSRDVWKVDLWVEYRDHLGQRQQEGVWEGSYPDDGADNNTDLAGDLLNRVVVDLTQARMF